MSLKTFPDWYRKRENVFEEARPELFVGRKHALESYWINLLHTNAFIENMALISQRKMGKTALLKRFCNVLYSEQREVIPLFYSFSQEETKQKLQVSEVAEDMLFVFLKQFAAFFFERSDFFAFENGNDLVDELLEINHSCATFLIKKLQTSQKYIEEKSGHYKIQKVFDIIVSLMRHSNMRCMMVIDEVQEMDLSIYDENDNLLHCSSALTRIYQMLSVIWLAVTGSKVSCITNKVIVDAMRNRISLESFYPLDENETGEYINKLLAVLEQKGYDGIHRDVFNVTGGNPYYIQQLFFSSHLYIKKHGQEKNFSCHENVLKMFDFEVRNIQGSLYGYWGVHFDNNAQNLNCDGDQPGITAKILHYIAKRSMELEKKEKQKKSDSFDYVEERIFFSEIVEKLKVEFELVKLKVAQLVDADFVEANIHGNWVIRITDRILPIFLVDHYYEKIFGKRTQEKVNKEIQNIMQGFRELQKEQSSTKKRLKNVETQQKKTYKRVKSNTSKISNIKGKDGEETIKKAIAEGRGVFKPYKKQIAAKTFVPDDNGTMYDIDLFVHGQQKKGKNPAILPLAIEVKNRDSKVFIAEVQHFVKALEALKKDQKLRKVKAYFVSTKGISKTGQKLLEENNIESLLFSEIS